MLAQISVLLVLCCIRYINAFSQNCTTTDMCNDTTITCTEGEPCMINCDGYGTCTDATFNCPSGAYECSLNCYYTYSCQNTVVNAALTDGADLLITLEGRWVFDDAQVLCPQNGNTIVTFTGIETWDGILSGIAANSIFDASNTASGNLDIIVRTSAEANGALGDNSNMMIYCPPNGYCSLDCGEGGASRCAGVNIIAEETTTLLTVTGGGDYIFNSLRATCPRADGSGTPNCVINAFGNYIEPYYNLVVKSFESFTNVDFSCGNYSICTAADALPHMYCNQDYTVWCTMELVNDIFECAFASPCSDWVSETRNCISSDITLWENGALYSLDGNVKFIVQNDGNLCLYTYDSGVSGNWVDRFCTNTLPSTSNYYLEIVDGVLVLNDLTSVLWESVIGATYDAAGVELCVEDCGYAFLKTINDIILWASDYTVNEALAPYPQCNVCSWGSTLCDGLDTIQCDEGEDCSVVCDGYGACTNKTIICPAGAYNCDVNCYYTYACQNTIIDASLTDGGDLTMRLEGRWVFLEGRAICPPTGDCLIYFTGINSWDTLPGIAGDSVIDASGNDGGYVEVNVNTENAGGAQGDMADMNILCGINGACTLNCGAGGTANKCGGVNIIGQEQTGLVYVTGGGPYIFNSMKVTCPPQSTTDVANCVIESTGSYTASLSNVVVYSLESFTNLQMTCEDYSNCIDTDASPFMYCNKDFTNFCEMALDVSDDFECAYDNPCQDWISTTTNCISSGSGDLFAGFAIFSLDGMVKLVVQNDGNLCLYTYDSSLSSNWMNRWCSGTVQATAGTFWLNIISGNVELHDSSNVLWESSTTGDGNSVCVEDCGLAILRDVNGDILWYSDYTMNDGTGGYPSCDDLPTTMAPEDTSTTEEVGNSTDATVDKSSVKGFDVFWIQLLSVVLVFSL